MEKDIRTFLVDGLPMTMADVATSAVRDLVREDLKRDIYGLTRIPWEEGDVVVDVGANIGMISIYLAKRYPKLKIFAFEPMPENFASLHENVKMNHVEATVAPMPCAITADGRKFEMIAHLASNTGGATGFLRNMELPEHQKATVASMTLKEVFSYLKGRCKLLKLDCEGAEHEIVESSMDELARVDYLSAELHINSWLEGQGHTIEKTEGTLRELIPEDRLRIHIVRMAE